MSTTGNHSRLILASASPRRRRLLEQVGLTFEIMESRIEESLLVSGAPKDCVLRIAEAKAGDIACVHPEAWIIGADTAVVIDDRILGKPVGMDQARDMLTRLSGRTHQVHTGYAILCRSRNFLKSAVVTTKVEFKTLSSEEIEWYLHTDEPFDKAGAYAIQGIGTFLVKRINGSYSNVVGLPVCEVIEELTRVGVVHY
jgi:septum formation protein